MKMRKSSVIQAFEDLCQQYIVSSTIIDYRAIIYYKYIIISVTNLDY